jgi:hypothetical protein
MEKHILTNEIQDPELLNFAIENFSELFGYLATGRVNIRINRGKRPAKKHRRSSMLCDSGYKVSAVYIWKVFLFFTMSHLGTIRYLPLA